MLCGRGGATSDRCLVRTRDDPAADLPLCRPRQPTTLTREIGTVALAQGSPGTLTRVRNRSSTVSAADKAFDPPAGLIGDSSLGPRFAKLSRASGLWALPHRGVAASAYRIVPTRPNAASISQGRALPRCAMATAKPAGDIAQLGSSSMTSSSVRHRRLHGARHRMTTSRVKPTWSSSALHHRALVSKTSPPIAAPGTEQRPSSRACR